MEIYDVFSMNGEKFLENVILKVSQTHLSRISTPRGGIHFSSGGGGGGNEVSCTYCSHVCCASYQ